MQISSKLFNQQSIRNFEKLNEGIQKTQEKISTGQNILSASDDPVAAVNLSVAKEQRDLLSRYQANAEAAKNRLNLSDEIFDQSIITLTRIMELTIQAGNGTGDTTAILQEIDALKEVFDPEIPVNIVDLGLIYDVEIDGTDVDVKMTLTAAGCGMGPYIAQQAEWAISELDDVEDVNVDIVFDPPWDPERITEDGKKLLGID